MKLGNNIHAQELQKALQGGSDVEVQQAWNNFSNSIVAEIRNDYMESVGDKNVLAQRGYRALTQAEEKFYNNFIEAAKSRNPQQAFTDLAALEDAELMPETIINDVLNDLVEEHPLLSKVNFVSASYITKWILNDHDKQTGVWGEVDAEITKEVLSAFRVVNIQQNKLSCFAQIPKGVLDLGPQFLDGYMRKVMAEAIAVSLEQAIITGTGKDMPIGLDRQVGAGVSVVDGEYPQKEAIAITELSPKQYGELIAQMAVTPNGHNRKINQVALIVNNADYLTKIMPAVTVQNTTGAYVENFAFPTDVIISNEVAEGQAIMALLPEYFMGVSGSKEGTIEFSDEYKFLEDKRTFKVKVYATGMPKDNNCALLLDITGLEERTIKVKNA